MSTASMFRSLTDSISSCVRFTMSNIGSRCKRLPWLRDILKRCTIQSTCSCRECSRRLSENGKSEPSTQNAKLSPAGSEQLDDPNFQSTVHPNTFVAKTNNNSQSEDGNATPSSVEFPQNHCCDVKSAFLWSRFGANSTFVTFVSPGATLEERQQVREWTEEIGRKVAADEELKQWSTEGGSQSHSKKREKAVALDLPEAHLIQELIETKQDEVARRILGETQPPCVTSISHTSAEELLRDLSIVENNNMICDQSGKEIGTQKELLEYWMYKMYKEGTLQDRG